MTDSNILSDDIPSDDLQGYGEEDIASSEPGQLQEFAYSILSICTQEQTGELSSKEAYHQIKMHWKELKQSQKKQKGKNQKGKH